MYVRMYIHTQTHTYVLHSTHKHVYCTYYIHTYSGVSVKGISEKTEDLIHLIKTEVTTSVHVHIYDSDMGNL